MLLNEQSDRFLNQLSSRRRDKAKPSTVNAYRSLIKTWVLPYFGQTDLSEIENGQMRHFVAHLDRHKLSASTIVMASGLVKSIISSALDENGNELYPRKWNNDFVDLPRIDPRQQRNPILNATEVSESISRADRGIAPLFVLLASTGLRIGEALALKVGPDTNEENRWDGDKSIVYVRKTLYRGNEQEPKTPAGIREIDICPALNTYLQNIVAQPDGEPLFNHSLGAAYRALKKAKVPGFHSFRRFRVTHLEGAGVPHSLVQFWTGHAAKDVSGRYTKYKEFIEMRKEWVNRAGLGFEL